MKVVKLEHGFKVPPLWHFMKQELPPSLLACTMDNGYGHVFGVTLKNNTLKDRLFGWFTADIARIWDESCELYQPQYFSDFEDVIRKYEAKYGTEVEFRYWEAS